jgi:thiosulfate reductase cytochrome b subunit
LVYERTIKQTTHFALIVITILVILSGLGIAYYQTITSITLGVMDKTLAFKIHTFIFPIFLIILVVHSLMPKIIGSMRNNS